MSWIKKITGAFYYLIFLIVCTAIMLEVIFRILPTSESLKIKPVNPENPLEN